jgi:ABC-2 type transport system permease protein
MNDLAQLFIISKYQFKNYIRSKRLITLILITAGIGIAYILSIHFYVNTSYMDVKIFAKNWVSPLSYLIALASLFFGGDAIAGEYQNKTGYFLLPNPIKRGSILWGKYIASYLASTIVMLIYWAFVILNVYYYYNTLPVAIWYSLGFSFLFLLSLLALTYLFSSLLNNGTIAIVIVSIIYFLVLPVIDSMAMYIGYPPWFSINHSASILTLVFEGNYIGDYPTKQVLQLGPGFTITIFNPSLTESISVMLGYFIVSAIISTVLFHYKEMK